MDTSVRNSDPESSHAAAKSVNAREDVELAYALFRQFANGAGLTRGEFSALVLQHLITSKWKPDRPVRRGQSLRVLRIRRSDSIRRRLSDLLDKADGRLVVSTDRRDKQQVLTIAA